MTPDAESLARTLAAHPRWRWLQGMRLWGGDRIHGSTLGIVHGAAPDLFDWPTVGALFGMLATLGRASLRQAGSDWVAEIALPNATTITVRSPQGAGDAVATALLEAWEAA